MRYIEGESRLVVVERGYLPFRSHVAGGTIFDSASAGELSGMRIFGTVTGTALPGCTGKRRCDPQRRSNCSSSRSVAIDAFDVIVRTLELESGGSMIERANDLPVGGSMTRLARNGGADRPFELMRVSVTGIARL